MGEKNKKLSALFIFLVFFLMITFLFTQSVQARVFGGRLAARRQARFSQSSNYQPAQTAKPVNASTESRPSPQAKSQPAGQPAQQNRPKSSSASSSKGLTPDEQAVRQRRHEHYDKVSPEWNGKREKLDPDKVAKAAATEAGNLSKEAQKAYEATQRQDVLRYQKKQGVVAIDAIDPNTGAEFEFRRSKENGRNVYDVRDKTTGLELHQVKEEDRGVFALSPKGVKIKVGYGDPNNPEWAANGYYPTNLAELNVFAGFNRGDDHLISRLSLAAKSPSDLGQAVIEPLRFNLEGSRGLKAFAGAKDPNSGVPMRPELAVLLESDTLSEAAKVKIATGMLEDMPSFGRVVTVSKQLEKIIKADSLEDGFKREYAVYGSRNYQGKNLYFGIELSSEQLKPKASLEKLAKPIEEASIKPIASLERLADKPMPAVLPKWVDEHLAKRNFVWFPKKSWEEVVSGYGDIKVEKIRSYSDSSRGSVFYEVKINQPNGGRTDVMLFRLDKLTQ